MEPDRRGDHPDRRLRWSDERTDDLAALVRKNDERLDTVQSLLAAHDLQLVEYERERRMTTDHSFNMKIALITIVATALLGEIATIATIIVTGGGH